MTDASQQQSTGAEGQQVGSAGGDVRQMTVGQFIDVANQMNMDVNALNNLVSDIQAQIQGQGQQAGASPAQNPDQPAGATPAVQAGGAAPPAGQSGAEASGGA